MLWHDLEETSATLIAGVARSTLGACDTRSPGRETTFRFPLQRLVTLGSTLGKLTMQIGYQLLGIG
jgi:hypothetical protein